MSGFSGVVRALSERLPLERGTSGGCGVLERRVIAGHGQVRWRVIRQVSKGVTTGTPWGTPRAREARDGWAGADGP